MNKSAVWAKAPTKPSDSHALRITEHDRTAALTRPAVVVQRRLGNQGIQRLLFARRLQPKLTVSDPNDIYEQEADRIADRVMRMSGVATEIDRPATQQIHRLCPACKEEAKRQPLEKEEKPIQTKPLAPGWTVQRQGPEEEEELVQAKTESNGVTEVTAATESAINALPGRGHPLPETVRNFMEPRFNADFRAVRVHTDGHANDLARAVYAQAFTVGRDVVFAAGRYALETGPGRRLLAHELTHVVQQTSSPDMLSAGPDSAPAARPGGEPRSMIVRSITVRGNLRRHIGGLTVVGLAGSGPLPAGLIRHRRPSVEAQLLQRDGCPPRPGGESRRSRLRAGILPSDSEYHASDQRLYIYDFPVNSSTLPAGVTTSAAWQRAMSLIVGDPSNMITVTGYTDCVGSQAENARLRDQRAASVLRAMPRAAQGRVAFSGGFGTVSYLDTNASPAGRARNRSVTVFFSSVTPSGQDRCDRLTRASSIDEYLFLVRCMESRLGLGSAAQAATALSLLRQIYYGNATWSRTRDPFWNDVITRRPWRAGRDPRTRLGTPLFGALQATREIRLDRRTIRLDHMLAGLDAMMHPHNVELTFGGGAFQPILPTTLINEAWGTWAGDVGDAAGNYIADTLFNTLSGNHRDYFNREATDPELLGNIESFAMRIGLAGVTPPQSLGRALSLQNPLSEILMQYYRITGSAAGQGRQQAIPNFIRAYGGIIAGRAISNRAQFTARLRRSVDEFTRYYTMGLILRRGNMPTRPPGSPAIDIVMANAVNAMTRLYVDWLIHRL